MSPGTVGPLHALLAARLQSSWNRSSKELGRSGRAILIATLTCIIVFIVLPLTIEVTVAGYWVGSRLVSTTQGRVPFEVGCMFLAVLTFGGGFVSGVIGGTQQVRWEQYRGYPLRYVYLVAAEYVACLGEIANMALAFGIAAFLVGFGIGQPSVWHLLPIVWFSSVLIAITVQLLVGALGDVAVRRLRYALIGFVLLVAFGAQFMNRLVHGVNGQAAFRAYASAIKFVPSTWSLRGLANTALGHPALGIQQVLSPFLAVVPLVLVASVMMVREQDAGAEEPESQRTRHSLWTFDQPLIGIARLQWETILSSRFGRFGFFLPIMSVAFAIGPLSRAFGGLTWRVPFVFGYVTFFSGPLLFNQFGLDGQSVKGLFLLPVTMGEVLRGKLLGFAAVALSYAMIAFGLLLAFSGLPLSVLVAGLFLSGCYFVTLYSVGTWMSAMFPRPIPRWKGRGEPLPLPVALLNLGVSIACMTSYTSAFVFLQWLAPLWLVPGMAALFAVCATIAWLCQPALERYWLARQEAIVEAMG